MTGNAKAKFYGLPERIVDAALAEGVHPDCLRQTLEDRNAHQECEQILIRIIDTTYADIPDPAARVERMVRETRLEQGLDH